MDRALLGIFALLALAFLCSEDRRRIPWRTVIAGLALQLVLALLLLRVPPATRAVFAVNDAGTASQNATQGGTRFVFGYLGGPPLPFAESHPGASFVLAFQALPLVLTISALASLLFHWGVLQRVTGAFAWLLRRTMGVGGALALAALLVPFGPGDASEEPLAIADPPSSALDAIVKGTIDGVPVLVGIVAT